MRKTETNTHCENDPAAPKPRLPRRTADCSTQPSMRPGAGGGIFDPADDPYSICNTSVSWLLVCGSSKQQEIPIRIFDDEIFGTPRLLLQFLVKGNASGLKLKKQ